MDRAQFEIALTKRGIHTTVDLSDQVGISRQTLTPIRHGRVEASVEVAEQIKKNLNLSEQEFISIFPYQAAVIEARDKLYKG